MSLTDNIIMPGQDYQNACDAIRVKTGEEDLIKSGELVEQIEKVFEAGQKSEYDKFWDDFQDYGKKTDYNATFCGTGWKDDIFLPKYDLIADGGAFDMFRSNGNLINLTKILEKQNIKLSTKNAYRVDGMFYWCKNLVEVPEIDCSGCSYSVGLGLMFYHCEKLETIKKLILPTQPLIKIDLNSFAYCSSLKNIEIEGIIGYNINFQWSPLSKSSITSVINALSLNSSDLTIFFSLSAVNNAFETSSGAADGSTSEEWATLIATKPNWTISLV